ncbi:MAG: hypothetical protein WCA91_10385 [Candidatus Acidiferrales bacterium]
MTKFLFTMLPANDLGLPTRLLPIARFLANRGHEVAAFNPSPAPAQLIEEAGLANLPMPERPMPALTFDDVRISEAWDVDDIFAGLYTDDEYVRAATAMHVDLIRDYAPDAVVDSFGLLTCLATRILKLPLATVLQGNFHPASNGFLWWKNERPSRLPSAAPAINKAAAQYGLPPIARCIDLLAGDLFLIVGTPETDPLPPTANVTYVGQIVWQRGDSELPDWVSAADMGLLRQSSLQKLLSDSL